MSDKPIALLPCPFCGNDPNWHEDQGVFCMHRKCILFGMIFTDEAKWNRRSAIPRAQIEAMKEWILHSDHARACVVEEWRQNWPNAKQIPDCTCGLHELQEKLK